MHQRMSLRRDATGSALWHALGVLLDGGDALSGGRGRDVIYGGPGVDLPYGGTEREPDGSKDVLYGGDDSDFMSWAGGGEGVLHGGEGNDHLEASYDGQRDNPRGAGFGEQRQE
jgi:RTX calcium-binding nonapeptide repeat (4 copies)